MNQGTFPSSGSAWPCMCVAERERERNLCCGRDWLLRNRSFFLSKLCQFAVNKRLDCPLFYVTVQWHSACVPSFSLANSSQNLIHVFRTKAIILFPFVHLNGSFLATYVNCGCIKTWTEYALHGASYAWGYMHGYLSLNPRKMTVEEKSPSHFFLNSSVVKSFAQEAGGLGSMASLSEEV